MSENLIACNLTYDEISCLADKVESGKLSKIKIKTGDDELVIEKASKLITSPMPAVSVPAMTNNTAAAAVSEEPVSATSNEAEMPSGNVVKAPIVGTYYEKPAPDKAPFVQVGQTVKKGDVLMIIESMKLMNEVQSEFDGVVKKILVKDADAVEFDQPIMIIG